MHQPEAAAVHLHGQGEGGFGRPFLHGLLGAAAPRLLIAQGHRLNAANQVAEGGVLEQVAEGVAVGRGHQGHAPLGDRAGRLGLQLRADFINDDDLGHVVFHRLDHHLVLQLRPGHLHAPGPADGGVGDVAIAGDLVAGVDHDHAALQVIGQHPGDLAQGRGFAHPGPPHQQQRLARIQQVAHHRHRAVNGPAHPAGEANDLASAVANGADAMQGALDPGPVIAAKGPQLLNHGAQIPALDHRRTQGQGPAGVAGLRDAAQIEHHFQQLIAGLGRCQGQAHGLGQQLQQAIEVIGHPLQVGPIALGIPRVLPGKRWG